MQISNLRPGAGAARFGAGLLLTAAAVPALSAITEAAATAQSPQAAEPPEIVVIGERLFRDVRPERDLDETAISTYGVSTIDELVAELQGELDGSEDDEPVILVNGERVHDLDEIGAYPVEALRRLQLLPRGSATKLGGKSGQRVLSLSTHRQMRSAAVTVAPRFSTAGGGHSRRSEALFTHIRGPTRANVSLRLRDEDALFESDRDIVQPEPRLPFATSGNVVAYPNLWAEIDPLLSEAAGRVVTVAPIPSGAAPNIADFAAAASPEETDLGSFRTLRPEGRTYELNGSFATRLAPWLSSSATLRLARSRSRSGRGLASALFALGADNLYSPFSNEVGLALYRGESALTYRSLRHSGDANLTLNASFGRWRASLNGRYSLDRDTSRSERAEEYGAIALADDLNPFAVELGDLIDIRTDVARSDSRSRRGQLTLTGPALKLPAGDVIATLEGRLESSRIRSRSRYSAEEESRSFHRSERALRAAAELPLASRRNDFLPILGELSANAEISRVRLSDSGTLHAHALGVTWEPRPPLRLRAAYENTASPADIQLLGAPVLITPGVRTFDVLTGETVDVTQVTGGNPLLDPERKRVLRASGLVRLMPSVGLQLNGEYTDSDQRDFATFLPPTSAAIVLAFSDRFVRDASGALTLVDLRPVSFAAHRQKRLRYGISLNAPLGSNGPRVSSARDADGAEDSSDDAPAPPPRRAGGPRTRLLLSANHSLVLSDEIEIRRGLDRVNLLDGGAIGIGGGRVRHQLDTTAGITAGGLGTRVSVAWRGPSTLETRIDGEASELRFSPLLLVNVRAFADLRRLLRDSAWSDRTRISLNVTNLANRRQRVRNASGGTPLQYQPGYRDPLGRTIELELRKLF
jgi:outer membrane receptor protein involved in Fe transport